jgi:hypothetical protein
VFAASTDAALFYYRAIQSLELPFAIFNLRSLRKAKARGRVSNPPLRIPIFSTFAFFAVNSQHPKLLSI